MADSAPRANMSWSVMELEPGASDVAYVRLSNGAAEIEAMFYVHLAGREALSGRLDIQGPGPNSLGG